MAFIKCIDCGKIYDTNLEACPQCGSPTEQQQLPQIINSNDSTPVDVTSIFNIEEDKFEETKEVNVLPRIMTSTSINNLCESLQVNSPMIIPHYDLNLKDNVGQLSVVYFEWPDFKEELEKNNKELVKDHCSPCKRMIINIDDNENIRLDSEEYGLIGYAKFPISQDGFLKCCNAKKLEFKIIKESGKTIVVNGYYKIDPNTGAEIDVNGDVVPENDLILNFQALYNYAIDPNVFKNAFRRRQILDDWLREKNNEKETEEKRKVGVEEKQNKNKGLIWLLTGILGFFVGVFLFFYGFAIRDFQAVGILLIIIGVCMLVTGPIIAVYGGTRMKGLSSSDALKEAFGINMNNNS